MVSEASSDSLVRRFGGWRETLPAAGGALQRSDRERSDARTTRSRSVTRDQMISKLRRVAQEQGSAMLPRKVFDVEAREIKASAVERRFGSWLAARRGGTLLGALVVAASTTTTTSRISWPLELMTAVDLSTAKMSEPPRISNSAYSRRFGTWTRALVAFIERVNSDLAEVARYFDAVPQQAARRAMREPPRAEDVRTVRVGLRYEVLRRDHFRCVLCGASPAVTRGVVLHVDHVMPVAHGGKTAEENLRTLCGNLQPWQGLEDRIRPGIAGRLIERPSRLLDSQPALRHAGVRS